MPTCLCLPVYAYLSMPTCLCLPVYVTLIRSIDRIVYSVRWLVVQTVVVWLWRRSSGSSDGHLALAMAVWRWRRSSGDDDGRLALTGHLAMATVV